MPKTEKIKPSAAQRVTQKGQCRIIAGKWRGRIIRFDDAEGLRPTTDRIRETVFNWLQAYIPRSRCLDCFAGSGVLGFEALSRGADEVVFIEQNKITLQKLKANGQMLDAANVVFLHADTLAWLEGKKSGDDSNKHPDQMFDLVFLDPPFHSDLLEKSSTLLNSSGCLAEDAIIYVEHAINDDVVLPENWRCLKEKLAGQVAYKLFEKQP
ncbi:MAG: 16S rRNA (guanine(966)-N(2))-methyltransferase RsmD [Gammaproteobacteria bacterium]